MAATTLVWQNPRTPRAHADATRPGLAKAARRLCSTMHVTGEPCTDCIKLAAAVLHDFCSVFPNEPIRPSDLDDLIRTHSMDA